MRKRILLFTVFGSLFASVSLFAGKDTIPPVTTASPGGGSFTSPITVTLAVNESATTYFCMGTTCQPSTRYASPIQIAGSATLRYYSVDRRRNAESVKSETYIIITDTTPPVTTASPAGGTYSGSVTVTLSANEPASTYYCTESDCTPATAYGAALQFTSTTTLRFRSRDSAGNTENVKSQTYTIQNQACGSEPALSQHASLAWTGSYQECAGCHANKVNEVLNSTHYQWKGSSAEMISGAPQQGKTIQLDAGGKILPGASAMNAYCINILGNWSGCGSCHIGLGATPTTSNYNIDCLVCHQKLYKRKKVNGVFQPDTANMCISMDTAVRTVHRPKRENCAQCHAYGGGGDNFKRGDLAVAHVSTTDTTFDRHMATAGANLKCQDCHITSQHKIAGRGSDLRPLDSTTIVTCANCHAGKAGASGHETADVNRHVGRVACQTCHIPTFAKNAADTSATEATEVYRDWALPEWNAAKNRWEPTLSKANNITPKYLHWNGTSWGYNLLDQALWDPATGTYPMSRPKGGINDTASKLYPFKYKTAKQAFSADHNLIIPIDTAKYWAMPASPTAADINAAVAAGLTNLGLTSTAFNWITTDEYQLIAHEVPPASNNVLTCTKCHTDSTASQMKLGTDLGYTVKKQTSDLCNDCHAFKTYSSGYSNFRTLHNKHVTDKKLDCSRCHNFTRPERGLRQ